jgi:hypothetical protein
MKLRHTFIFLTILFLHSVTFAQKSNCSWFYDLNDNGFEDATKIVTATSYGVPTIHITSFVDNPKYKGIYVVDFSWIIDSPPLLYGGDNDIIDASIKINGVNKKYSFTTKYITSKNKLGSTSVYLYLSSPQETIKDFMNDLKIGSELNIIVNYGKPGLQSPVYKYNLNCSSSCISKLMAP